MADWSPDIEALRETVVALREKHHLPGVGVGVVVGDEVVHAEGIGWADVVAGTPYTPNVRHRIGSVTKTMVALCVMALVEQGRLRLADRVPEILGDIKFHGHAGSLTVWHLLTHTGGIGEAPNPDDLKQPFEKLFYESPRDASLAELYADGVTIECEPGTKWAYANHGFALLGEIVSRLEDAPLNKVVQRRVFEPLGMSNSDLEDEPHPGLARGYSQADTPEARQFLKLLGVQLESDTPVDGHNLPGKYTRVWGNGGAGAVQSTVLDMCTYASALLAGGRGIVSEETLRAMFADQYRPDGRLPGRGLGFGVRNIGPYRMVEHGGAVFGGWNTLLALFPELNAGLVLHVNVMLEQFDALIVPRVLRALLRVPERPLPDITVDPLVLETAPGVYELSEPGPLTNFRALYACGRVQIRRDGEDLTLYSRRGPWKDGVALRPADAGQPDFFAMLNDSSPLQYMAMLRDEQGRVTGLRFQQLVDMRRSEVQPWR